jgi:fermentation-respiration switch protein FrsA (DUF1100 family)
MSSAFWLGTRWVAADHRSVGAPPADLPARPVEFRSKTGDLLRGWFVPGSTGSDAIVLMHGSHETRRAMLGRARFLNRNRYAVLLFDFHSYGESEGDRTGFGLTESGDAAAAVDFLRSMAPGERLGAIGFSLGGAASLLGAKPLAVDALIVEAVYPEIATAVSNRLRMRLGSLGAWFLTPLFTAQLHPRWGIEGSQLSPVEAIRRLRAPVFVIAGTDDPRTTLADSRRLFAAAPEPKQFWAVPGAAHVNFERYAPREYEERVLDFFARHLRGGADSALLRGGELR